MGVWKVSGLCLVFGRCLEGIRRVPGGCLEDVWKMSGGLMEGAWKVCVISTLTYSLKEGKAPYMSGRCLKMV